MTEGTAELLEFLQKGGDLKTLLAQQTPAALGEMLDRAALACAFDERLYTDVLGRGVADCPAFTTLTSHSDVQPLGGEPGWFRVRDAAAERRATAWRQRVGNAPWLDLEQRLAAEFERRGEGWQHFRLHHLVAVDPRGASGLFDSLFAAADTRFDLARCEDLLRIAERRNIASGHGQPHTTSSEDATAAARELGQRVMEARCRFNARVQTADDWYRSLRYFERPALQKHLVQLLRPGDHKPWIVQLHAAGGRGKTMLLRWFAARTCVPAGIAVARLDFDLIDVQPDAWVLLLDIARQLHAQISGSELDRILERSADAVDATGQTVRSEQSSADDSGRASAAANAVNEQARRATERVAQQGFRARLGLDLPKALGVALRESVGDAPVVIVVDTFEEAMLRHLTDLPELINVVARLHAECPSVRLVLAGRYDLVESDPTLWRAMRVADERDAELQKAFRKAFVSVPVTDFTTQESRAYLVLRGLANDARLDAAVECGKHLPLRLALVADLLQSGTPLSADDLRRAGDFDLVYLVERVVSRIESPTVRWLLGYGVVPRRLTFEIFREVLAPELAAAMRGAVAPNDGARDDDEATGGHLVLPTKLAHWADVLPTGIEPPRSDDELRAAWDDLCRYASGSSWVFRSKVDPKALEFHEDVRVPLMRLLGQYPVAARLHVRAAGYFADEAAAAPSDAASPRWAAAVCDEVFHRFCGGEPDASSRWHGRLREAEERSDHRAAMALSELVLTKGLLNVDDAVRAVAWRAQAVAAFDSPDGDPASRLRRVEQAMNELDRLPAEVVDRIVPKGERLLFRAQVAFFAGDATSALRLSDESLAALGDEPRRVDALELAALVRAAVGRGDALPMAMEALSLQRRLAPDAGPREAMLAHRLADTALIEGDHELALAALRSTRERLASFEDPGLAVRLAITEANIAVRAGRPIEAWQSIEATLSGPAAPAAGTAAARDLWLEGTASLGPALLAAMASTQAIQLGQVILDAMSTSQVDADPRVRSMVLQIRLSTGIAHRSRLENALATSILSSVFEQAFSLRDMSLASHAVIALAEQDLTVTGNLRTMEGWLATGNRLELPPRTEQLHRLAGLHVMFLGRRGAGSQIASAVDAMRAPVVGAPPQARAAFFVAALVAEEEIPRRERAADDLLASLAQIDPPSARSMILGKLPLAEALPKRPERVRRVTELLPLATGTGDGSPSMGLSRGDAILYDLAVLEAHRVMGDDVAAAIAVRRAWDAVTVAADDAGVPSGAGVLVRVFEAATRLGVRLAVPEGLLERAAAGTQLRRRLPVLEEMLHRPADRADAETTGVVAALHLAAAENVLGPGRPTEVQLVWVAEIEQRLRVAGLDRSLLARRLRILRALMHRARGDTRAADNDFGAADAIASECGDERDRKRIATLRSAPPADDTRTAVSPAAPPAAPSAPAPADADAKAEARAAAVLESPPKLWLRATLTTSKAVEVRTLRGSSTGGEPPLAGVHWALREVARGEVYAERLVEALTTDHKKVASELRHLLVDRDADRTLRGVRGDAGTPVRIELDGSELLPLPWEYAMAASAHAGLVGWFLSKGEPAGAYRAIDAGSSMHHRVVWLQEALNALGATLRVDGFLGPSTAATFAATVRTLRSKGHDASASDRTLIEQALVKAAPRRQVVAIGIGNPISDAVDISYRSELLFSQLEPASVSALATAFVELAPAVVFLRATVRESSAFGRLALDFSPLDDTERQVATMKSAPLRRGVQMSIAEVDELLCMLPPGRRPLVVLDVPSPRNDSTRIRQMLARNAFAGELFLRNNVPAVLAMGGLGLRLSHVGLKNALRIGSPIGRTVQALRSAMIPASALLGAAVAHADCVLYCHDPMWRPVLDPGGFDGKACGT